MSKKEKFPLYLSPEKRQPWNGGIRKMAAAVSPLLLRTPSTFTWTTSAPITFLPTSVQSYLDGRLDQFENRMASLLFKQAVELDMGMSTLADCVKLDEEYLRRRRANSIANVKRTNGRLRFEQIAKDTDGSDDEWQD